MLNKMVFSNPGKLPDYAPYIFNESLFGGLVRVIVEHCTGLEHPTAGYIEVYYLTIWVLGLVAIRITRWNSLTNSWYVRHATYYPRG